MTAVINERARVVPIAGRRSAVLRNLPGLALLVDAVVVSVTVLAGVALRESLDSLWGPDTTSYSFGLFSPAVAVGWIGAIALTGSYAKANFGAGAFERKTVLRGTAMATAGLSIVCFLASYPLSRSFFAILFLVGAPGLVAGRTLLYRGLHASRRRGNLQQRLLILGTVAHIDEIATVLGREAWLGYDVVGALTVEHDVVTPGGIAVLGCPAAVRSVIAENAIDVVFVADSSVNTGARLRSLVWELEDDDVRVVVAPSVADVSQARVRVKPVAGLPLIHLDKPSTLKALKLSKRAFDIVVSCAVLIVFSPVLAFAAWRIRAHDGGPVIFRQARVGTRGVEFTCLKFRTMVVDAESRLSVLAGESTEPGLFKMRNDPRITTPGVWLRRFSLDELPQLVNVLRGEMSLVGPRPGLVSEVDRYSDLVGRRLRVRPGMTGLWQVSGRSDLSYEEAVRLDLYYVDNWSMVQDLKILVSTFGAVLGSRGAY